MLRSHIVRTLPQLMVALTDLTATARELGAGPINLANFDPERGCNVTLERDDDSGLWSIRIRRNAA